MAFEILFYLFGAFNVKFELGFFCVYIMSVANMENCIQDLSFFPSEFKKIKN